MATRNEAREATLAALEDRIVRSVEELVSGDDWRRAIEFAARFRTRSFNNTLLIFAQHLDAYEQGRVPTPTPTWVAGYNDWRKMGRWPEKGGGYQIRGPVKAREASATPGDPTSWRRLRQKEKPRPGEVVRRRMVNVVPAWVWDVSRTHGAPLPELPTPKLLEGGEPAGLRQGLLGQIEDLGFEPIGVADKSVIGSANGLTDFDTHQTFYRLDMPPAAQLKTIGHERGHIGMHGPDQQEARQHRGIGEVEAESVALMVLAAHGMDTSDYTIPYVAGWASSVDGKDPVQVVRATGERVCQTAKDILDGLDTIQLGNGQPLSLRAHSPEREAPEQAHVEPLPERAQPAGRVVAERGL